MVLLTHHKAGWSALIAAILVGFLLLAPQNWLLGLTGTAIILTLLLAWQARMEPSAVLAAICAMAFWGAQLLLPPIARWGNGLGLTAMLLTVTMIALVGGEPQSGNRSFRSLGLIALLLTYISSQLTFLTLHPAYPFLSSLLGWLVMAGWVSMTLLGLTLLLLLQRALTRQHQPLVRHSARLAAVAYLLYLAQYLLPLWGMGPASPILLLAAPLTLWLLLVMLVVAVIRLPNKSAVEPQAQKRPKAAWRVTLDDYLTLMKYRVASLLLLTTLGAMIVAAQGWPGWSLVGWVMLGGLLSVGGAGALNHYLDRDIDVFMGRTSLRPIPAGRMAPWKALLFGLFLSVIQFVIFWFKVNPPAAWLSTAGLLYYVFIYTILLKRTTRQNIVIGGAAGAFPPLVGWVAVTGTLSWGALFLFAIVFYWTPPHFWALALMRRDDYARAGVPMLPVVSGDEETRRQIVIYTLLMVPLTLLMVPLGLMGALYLLGALLLNGKFLWDAVRLYREPSNRAALTLYKYSLLYLALLFVVMALDRALLA